MKYHIQKLVEIMQADAALQTLLGGTSTNKRIYPIIPDQLEDFPCIIYQEIDGGFNTIPTNTAQSTIQFNIYVKDASAPKSKIEDIADRINVLLNYYMQSKNNQMIDWFKEVLRTDANEPDRRLFGKILRYQMWLTN